MSLSWLSAPLAIVGVACSFAGSSGSGGSPDVDGGGIDVDGATPAAKCGGAAVYIDDFNGDQLASHWNVFRVGDVSVGGALTLDPTSTAASGLTSGKLIDLRDDRITIEVPQHFGSTSARAASFVLARSADTFFGFHMTGDLLIAEVSVDGTATLMTPAELDRTAHRFLQLREADGTVHFETSADGVTFDPFTTDASPAFIAAVRVQILAADGSGPNDLIQFDNLNGGREASSWCAASTFVDDFADQSIDPRWLNLVGDNLCAGNVESSGLTISTNAGTAFFDNCALLTGSAYELTEDGVSVVMEAISDVSAQRFVNIHAADGAFFGFSHSIAGLCPYSVDAQGSGDGTFGPACTNYNPALIHWRIRASGAGVTLEVSDDEVAWIEVAAEPAPFALDEVGISFGLFVDSGQTPAVTQRVLGYN